MKAVILCAGKGSRMEYLGEQTPKVLMEVNGKSLLQRWTAYFKKYGITELCINTHHLAEKIEHAFGNGNNYGVHIQWYRQPGVMGTASVLKKFDLEKEKEPFVIVFGDTMLTLDLAQLIKEHREKNAEATILVNKHHEPWRKGVVTVNGDFRIVDIVEKPDIRTLSPNQYCVHVIMIVEPHLLKYIDTDQEWLVEHFFTKLIKQGMRIDANDNEDASDDMNTVEDLKRLEAYLERIEGKALKNNSGSSP